MTESHAPDSEEVLHFWFGEGGGHTPPGPDRNRLWWQGHPDDDRAIRERFGELVEKARAGDLDHWKTQPRSAVALVLLLDQFTRCLGRGTPEAFAGDAQALAVCQHARAHGLDRKLPPVMRGFLYMPLMHAEDRAVAERSVEAFRGLSEDLAALGVDGYPDNLKHAVQHAEIVKRFGRYPHRNEILGRESTDAEKEFLASGGSRFGQKKKT